MDYLYEGNIIKLRGKKSSVPSRTQTQKVPLIHIYHPLRTDYDPQGMQ